MRWHCIPTINHGQRGQGLAWVCPHPPRHGLATGGDYSRRYPIGAHLTLDAISRLFAPRPAGERTTVRNQLGNSRRLLDERSSHRHTVILDFKYALSNRILYVVRFGHEELEPTIRGIWTGTNMPDRTQQHVFEVQFAHDG